MKPAEFEKARAKAADWPKEPAMGRGCENVSFVMRLLCLKTSKNIHAKFNQPQKYQPKLTAHSEPRSTPNSYPAAAFSSYIFCSETKS